MRLRNVVHKSLAFILFGVVLLVIGSVMLIAASRYASASDLHATVLRICGQIFCATGGFLIAGILSTCLYFGFTGTQHPVFSWQNSSQPAKDIQPQKRPRLSEAPFAGYTWAEKDKFVASKTPTRSNYLREFQPGGDVKEVNHKDRFEEFRCRQTKMSTDQLHNTANWSNSAQFPCPRLGRRRRGQSADPMLAGFDCIPNRPSKLLRDKANALDLNMSHQSPRRMWMPDFNFQNRSTLTSAPSTDYGTSRLIGLALEPMGTMLYSGGRVKLGNYA